MNDHFTLSNVHVVPGIGFGTYLIAPEATTAIVLDALAAGYRHVDTAQNYGNEAAVGAAIRETNIARSDLFVTTKLPAEIKTYDGALAAFDRSMTNLGLDYVDLYLVHAPEPWDQAGANYDAANREVWRAMETIYRSGRAKAIGVSNFNVHDLKNILAVATIKPMVDQIQYYVGYTQPEIVHFAKENDLLIEAFTPLARGALADNPIVEEIAAKYHVSFAQLALQYCLATQTLPLVKATNPAHMHSNRELDFQLDPTDLDALNQVTDHSDIWHFE